MNNFYYSFQKSPYIYLHWGLPQYNMAHPPILFYRVLSDDIYR